MAADLTPAVDHDAFLDHLALLSKKHLLFFRLEVGRSVLETFYGGDLAAFHSHDPRKPDGFGRFVAERAETLAALGGHRGGFVDGGPAETGGGGAGRGGVAGGGDAGAAAGVRRVWGSAPPLSTTNLVSNLNVPGPFPHQDQPLVDFRSGSD